VVVLGDQGVQFTWAPGCGSEEITVYALKQNEFVQTEGQMAAVE